MVKTEEVVFHGETFSKTYSDAGFKIERDGIQYDEAIDPLNSGRVYTETNVPVEEEPISDSEALSIITGTAQGGR